MCKKGVTENLIALMVLMRQIVVRYSQIVIVSYARHHL